MRFDKTADTVLQARTTYHPPTEDIVKHHDTVRDTITKASMILERAVPPSPEKEQMHVRLQEVMFWANAGIARNHNQFELDGTVRAQFVPPIEARAIALVQNGMRCADCGLPYSCGARQCHDTFRVAGQ
jgi:hypothetical protein